MFDVLRARIQQKYRTIPFPGKDPALPTRFRGLPVLEHNNCVNGCDACVKACPVEALKKPRGQKLSVDLGRCLFCTDCVSACPANAISFSREYKLATNKRDDLKFGFDEKEYKIAKSLSKDLVNLFGRSLKLRQVSAAGCNACEADLNVLSTVGFDLGRFGIQFVASPRHADGIVLTGPVSNNMKLALKKTYDAVSNPKIVICIGACAISGGPFAGHNEVNDGVGDILPVDLYIPGCPPHPITILDGLLRCLGRR